MQKLANISRFESLQTHANRSMGMQSEMSVFNFGDEEAMIENDEDEVDEEEEDVRFYDSGNQDWEEDEYYGEKPAEYREDEKEFQKALQDEWHIHSYKDFADRCGNMVLANNIVKRFGDGMELVSGYLPVNEDVFQWFIIDDPDFAIDNTSEPVFYDDDLDLYILGVTHCGTSWSMVPPPRMKGDMDACFEAWRARRDEEIRQVREASRNRK